MLQQFTPEEFDERLACEMLDGEPEEVIERFAEILKRGFAALSLSKDVQPDMFDPLKPRHDRDWEPAVVSPFEAAPPPVSAPVAQVASPQQAAAMFATTFGPPQRKGA